jgi:hypothetical protein
MELGSSNRFHPSLVRHEKCFRMHRRSVPPAAALPARLRCFAASDDEIPPGCARYSVTLSKPLGLILEQDRDNGSIYVAEVVPEGNADRNGTISAGDILIATSGYTRTTEQKYGEIVVRGGERVVRLLVRGERFETVMAAISSHPATVQVTLEFQRC